MLGICVGFIIAKTNILVRCWIWSSNILAQFSVPCLCGLFFRSFIYL